MPAREVDLLVAGAGPAGMTAALIASLEGLDVLLCEKSGQVGGTGATSAGTLWIPGNSQSKAAGYDDSAADADRYLSALIGEGANRALREAYLATGPTAVDYLVAKTDVQFVACGTHPDYRSNMPGAAVSGRAIVPAPFDGRLLGRDFKRLRPPIPEFMLLGGMMIGKADIAPLVGRFKSPANFWHAARLFARYLPDRLRYPRGTRLIMGNALVGRLYYSLLQRKVPILLNASIVELTGDRSGVTGARLRVANEDIVVNARRGVVLATGGYAHNERFAKCLHAAAGAGAFDELSKATAATGWRSARALGAASRRNNARSGLWAPVSVAPRAGRQQRPVPAFRARPRQARPDRGQRRRAPLRQRGRRPITTSCVAMFESHAHVPTIPAWLICDAAFIAHYGLGIVYPRRPQSRRNSSRRLSSRARRRSTTLAGKTRRRRPTRLPPRSSAITASPRPASTWISAKARPNSTAQRRRGAQAQPVHRAARHAALLCAGGLAGRHRGRAPGLPPTPMRACWHATAQPIPGLYACGNDMASVMGGSYPGPGITLGPALVFAYRAVMHARDDARTST